MTKILKGTVDFALDNSTIHIDLDRDAEAKALNFKVDLSNGRGSEAHLTLQATGDLMEVPGRGEAGDKQARAAILNGIGGVLITLGQGMLTGKFDFTQPPDGTPVPDGAVPPQPVDVPPAPVTDVPPVVPDQPAAEPQPAPAPEQTGG